MKRTWLALAAGLALALTSAGTASATERLPAGDAPPGFWWGTDSFNVSVPGKAPYSMPFLGGAYGGYIGMTGNWACLPRARPGIRPVGFTDMKTPHVCSTGSRERCDNRRQQ